MEIPVYVDAGGYHPVALGDLPAQVTPTLARLAATYDLIIEAALEGDRDKAFAAFVNDPNCNDLDIAKKCINELIDSELEWLPRFKR